MVAFAFLLSVLTALLFGSVPARQASKADLNVVLKGLRTTGGAATRLRSALVVVELALALVLLVGAGLLTRSFSRLLAWDPGFDRTGLVVSWMLPPQGAGSAVPVMEQVRDAVAALPGVRNAALVSAVPLFGGVETGGLSIEGRPPFARREMPTIEWFDCGPHYFDTLGVWVLRGRLLRPADTATSPRVAVVNETLARRFFGGQNPIGQRVTVEDHASEMLGVVLRDIRPLRPDVPPAPQIYWPIEQYPRRCGVPGPADDAGHRWHRAKSAQVRGVGRGRDPVRHRS